MARWKARVEFLLSVIGLLFLSLTVEALQGKMCQNSLSLGGGRYLAAKIPGEQVVPVEYCLVSTKLDTFCYLTVQTAPCYVPSFWHNTGVWQTDGRTDGQTDGIAVASTALAMRALRRIVKTGRFEGDGKSMGEQRRKNIVRLEGGNRKVEWLRKRDRYKKEDGRSKKERNK